MNDVSEIQSKCKELISLGSILEAIIYLEDYTKERKPKFYNEILLLKNRFNDLSEKTRMNIISEDKLSIERSKLNYNLITIVDELNQDAPGVVRSKGNFFYLGTLMLLGKKITAFSLIFISIVIFFFRRDIFSRIFKNPYKAPVEELFFPTFMLIFGLIIFFHKRYSS